MTGVAKTWSEEWHAICRRFRWPPWDPVDAAAYFFMSLDDLLEFIVIFDIAAELKIQTGRLPKVGYVVETENFRRHLRSLTQLAEAAGVMAMPFGRA
jgi:hypothetical protein